MASANTTSSEILKKLEEQAPILPVDKQTRLDIYLRSANKLHLEATTQFEKQQKSQDISEKESAYILLLRFVQLIAYTIKKHPEYKSPSPAQKKVLEDLKASCNEALNQMSQLKETIKSHYETPEIPPTSPEPTAPPLSFEPAPISSPLLSPTIQKHFDHHHPLFRSIDDFDILQELGVGTFGACFKVFDKRSGSTCVLKKIPFNTPKDVQLISTEIQVLRKLSNPFIVTYYTTFLDGNNMCLVMEYCSGGDLYKWIQDRERSKKWEPLHINQVFEWAWMICKGMEHVHSKDILHRDIKPSNIFLTEANDKTLLKIGDFGLSYELMKKSRASTRAGTMVYWSPEIFNNEAPGKEADVYSVGCVLYEMCMGTSRSAGALLMLDKKDGLLQEVRHYYGNEVYTLIAAMVRQNVKERPSFEKIVKAMEAKDLLSL